ncbi:MAG: peptidase [Prochlorococcaceae cyanobacterium]
MRPAHTLLIGALALFGPGAHACPVAEAIRPWPTPGSSSTEAPRAPLPASRSAPQAASSSDYRERLNPTPAGWARLDHWCVWVEPTGATGPQNPWEQRWLGAVEAALKRWQREVSIERVDDPSRAQVRVRRQRPPLRQENGRLRASHGRALLELVQVQRQGQWRLEPHVEVLISPGQRPLGIEATSLHELGHAFGLWGHSDQPTDAMAAVPGPVPLLELSERDRATLRWLYGQPALDAPRGAR